MPDCSGGTPALNARSGLAKLYGLLVEELGSFRFAGDFESVLVGFDFC